MSSSVAVGAVAGKARAGACPEQGSDVIESLVGVLARLVSNPPKNTGLHPRTHEALAAEMAVPRTTVTRVLNRERPMSLRFICRLPEDLQKALLSARVEALGAMVVEPAHPDHAVQQLFSAVLGLGLLKPHAPAFGKLHMAKVVTLPAGVHEDRRRA